MHKTFLSLQLDKKRCVNASINQLMLDFLGVMQ